MLFNTSLTPVNGPLFSLGGIGVESQGTQLCVRYNEGK